MKVVIICYGLKENNTRLQPWRYLTEIGSGLNGNNIDVLFLTDGKSLGQKIRNIPVVHINRIRTNPLIPNKELISIIELENPDVILWSISPLDGFYFKMFKRINAPIIGIITGPIYSFSEITRLGIKELVFNFSYLFIPMLFTLIQSSCFRKIISSSQFKKIVVLSSKNKRIIEKKAAEKGKIICLPPGIDESDLVKPEDCDSIISAFGLDRGYFNILYLGSPVTIRGIDSLIVAVSKVAQEYSKIRLLVLSRRLENELDSEEHHLNDLIEKSGIRNKVKVISGFLNKDEVKKFFVFSDVVILPFKITPSDMPMSILEAMAMGKPVISTNIDGIPELIENGRGFLIEPNDEEELIDVIKYCISNKSEVLKAGEKASKYMQEYPRWRNLSQRLVREILPFANGR